MEEKPIQLSVHTPFKMLGLFIKPDSNQTREFENLRDKVADWTSHVRGSFIQGHDANTALQSTIFCTLAYALPATTLSRSQCEDILEQALLAAFPRFHMHQLTLPS